MPETLLQKSRRRKIEKPFSKQDYMHQFLPVEKQIKHFMPSKKNDPL